MQLISGLELQSNCIKLLDGFNGIEPKDIVARKKKNIEYDRLAVGINTYYPELQGGYYLNKEIVGHVQYCLDLINIKVVLEELYSKNNLMPVEKFGALEYDEEYYLINKAGLQGYLMLWEFHAGGGGKFYGDSCIMDFIISPGIVNNFKLILERESNKLKISLTA